jgi:hypothetical protein
MALEDVMALTNRLLTSADALAAVTARLRPAELGEAPDPACASSSISWQTRSARAPSSTV